METITVNASRAYDIHIGSGLINEAGRLIRPLVKGANVTIVSDDTVFSLYGQKLTGSLANAGFSVSSFVFPHGEEQKSLDTYGKLLVAMNRVPLTRHDAVIALGGGVTGDLTGFAAATYQRGIGFIQMPTTLLAAVDSSVGGKTAVNLPTGKNQAGCFYQPLLVICDTDTLGTLPEEEYKNGCAEIIKYAAISSEELFECIDKTPVKEQYTEVIKRCVSIKKFFVEEDEFDTGLRMMLNFGHTFGHAYEILSRFAIPHGFAVATGMADAARCAEKLGICDAATRDRLIALIEKYGLPTKADYPASDIASLMATDKKAGSGRLNLILPETVGRCRIESVGCDAIAGIVDMAVTRNK